MPKSVVVIASGETERRSLPHLVAHLRNQDIFVAEVRIPPRNRALNAEMAEKLVKAAWYQNVVEAPDKFVILVDVDGKAPDEVVPPLTAQLSTRLGAEIKATVICAYAQWHLEAWYFADDEALRGYLGRALGNVDVSKPDEIQNPKIHLKNLLRDRLYTALISEEIARTLDPKTIAQRSPSFRRFIDAVTNGNLAPEVGTVV